MVKNLVSGLGEEKSRGIGPSIKACAIFCRRSRRDNNNQPMNEQGRMTIEVGRQALDDAGGPEFVSLFRHGSLEVEFYKPDRVDKQQPHSRDEVYVVACGSGYFLNGDRRHAVETGEVLFVPAGVVHRFEDFSDDFATWVFFYGPEGGETP